MPFLDFILPDTLDPTVKLMINILVGIHLLAFAIWMFFLCRALTKSQQDNFKDQYSELEKRAKQKGSKAD